MFSKACKYGIRAILYLAVHSSEEKKIGVKEVSKGLDLPMHFLAKILQQLSKKKFISSSKGPSGGFFLTEENLEVTLEQVVEQIDGPDVFTSCIIGLPVCSSDDPCPMHVQALAYREGLMYQFKYQSVGELARRVRDENLLI
ncbi:MAG: Rrf2 family transcriptional regulator [Bacteroidetes bacterium]|nr:Rrf2 family transcriptional regulator [Bacteroidota bacterium]